MHPERIVIVRKQKNYYLSLHPRRKYLSAKDFTEIIRGREVLHISFVTITPARFKNGPYYILSLPRTGGSMMIISNLIPHYGELASVIIESIPFWTEGDPPDETKNIVVIQS